MYITKVKVITNVAIHTRLHFTGLQTSPCIQAITSGRTRNIMKFRTPGSRHVHQINMTGQNH